MTDVNELRELIAQVPDDDLRTALLAAVLPGAQRLDDLEQLLKYRRRVAVDGVVSPVDETDEYMRGLGDALQVTLLAKAKAEVDGFPESPGIALASIATALAELGYRHRDPDPPIGRGKVVACFDNGTITGKVEKLTGDGELVVASTPLAEAEAVFVIRKANGK